MIYRVIVDGKVHTIEAERYFITDGILTLYKEGRHVASFPSPKWNGVIESSDNAAPSE